MHHVVKWNVAFTSGIAIISFLLFMLLSHGKDIYEQNLFLMFTIAFAMLTTRVFWVLTKTRRSSPQTSKNN